MEQRTFGNTELKVSALGFGAGHIGGEDISEKDAEIFLNKVLAGC
jgi:aryl-alcohol dehydrogenase-like predicted oxidoreductase